MNADLTNAVILPDSPKTSSLPNALASCAIAFGILLSASALIIWPVCVFEGWNGDALITLMLAAAFFILFAACHYFDCDEARKRKAGF